MTLTRALPVLAGILTLASCSQPTAPEPQPLPAVTVIEGRLATPAGSGQVSVPGAPTVTAPVAADGRFSLTLPTAEQLAGKLVTAAGLLSALQCTGNLESDPAAQGLAVAALNLADGQGSRQVYAAEGSKPGLLTRTVSAQAWVYADRATTLTGEVDCARLLNVSMISSLPITANVALVQGWNPVTLSASAGANLLGQVSASGTLRNSSAVASPTVWRTLPELQAQISFP